MSSSNAVLASAILLLCLSCAPRDEQKPPAATQFGAPTVLASFPKDGEYFVVDGDLLLTGEEARKHESLRNDTPIASAERPYLLLDEGGILPLANRTITYAIARATFPSEALYNETVARVAQAGARWESVCPECKITFKHVARLDAKANLAPGAEPFMVVRYRDVAQAYLAASFFPKAPEARRYLTVAPEFFSQTDYDRTGILRHELGHILGYRHEHIRNIAGCAWESGSWKALTPYDSKSVMHYPCGGVTNTRLELSEFDIEGHRRAYAPRAE